MGFCLPGIGKALFAANQASSKAMDAPKSHLAVHVGDKIGWFMIPVSYLNQPAFQDLVKQKKNSDMIIQLQEIFHVATGIFTYEHNLV